MEVAEDDSSHFAAVVAVASPVLVPLMLRRNQVFAENRTKAEGLNRSRIDEARRLALPPLDSLEITVLSEARTSEGFLGEPGVSYLVKTSEGSLLFDVGFGPQMLAVGQHDLPNVDP